MNRTELAAELAEATGQTKKAVLEVVDALSGVILGALRRDEEVQLPGLGRLTKAYRTPRTGRNMLTGEKIQISGRDYVKLKVSKSASDVLNG